MHYALCIMHYALSIMHYPLYPMHSPFIPYLQIVIDVSAESQYDADPGIGLSD